MVSLIKLNANLDLKDLLVEHPSVTYYVRVTFYVFGAY